MAFVSVWCAPLESGDKPLRLEGPLVNNLLSLILSGAHLVSDDQTEIGRYAGEVPADRHGTTALLMDENALRQRARR
jgi:hypothetical protein